MDNQHLYDEAIVKLTEAQVCQSEITNCNAELQKAKIEYYKMSYYNYIMRIYWDIRHKRLDSYKNKKIKERDDKLNEAISKALEIIDNEIPDNVYPQNSLGMYVVGQIFSYMSLENIRLQYSAEVNARLSKITMIVGAKGMNDLWGQLQKFAG